MAVEVKLTQLEDRVDDLDKKLDAVDSKVDEALGKLDLALSRLPAASAQPAIEGWTLSKASQQTVGGVIATVILYLASALGLPLPVKEAEPPPEKTQAAKPTE